MSEHPGELDALPLADLLDPDSAATKLELRHALGLAWAEVLRLRGDDVTDVVDDCPADGCQRDYHHYHRTSPSGEVRSFACDGSEGDCDDEETESLGFIFTRCYCRIPAPAAAAFDPPQQPPF